jgi:alkylation response protein AidB-like acyl-CoA dehydrogenase
VAAQVGTAHHRSTVQRSARPSAIIDRMDGKVHRDFIERATAFLDANASRRTATTDEFEWGRGSDAIRVMGTEDPGREDELLAEAAAWRAKAFDAGVAWPGGPTAYGGGGLDPDLDEVYRQLEGGFDVPDQRMFAVAWDMVGPAVLMHGSEDLKRRFLTPIYRGELLCSQLLSEPEAGSDLAGLRTRAVRDGDEWVVNGQKVWNSYAHKARIGQLMARTDPEAPKHRGLTMFLLPLDTPGVDVRPLRQMTGEAEFNEVFLTDVRVPDANRVGEPGSGWRAVLTTLMSERASVGAGAASRSVDPVRMLTELARQVARADDPVVRRRLADVHIVDFLIRMVAQRGADLRAATGTERGAEGSILKLLGSRQNFRVGELAGELLGPAFAADTGEWGTYAWSRFLTGAPGLRIAGGTDEIQHNILGERVLGLPKEPA